MESAIREFHALANLFPLIEGQAFEELVADVRANGVREPVYTYEGKILDGRNRWRAAQAAQKTVAFREFEGTDPVAFVISMNLRRRHLDESQRSLIAGKLATLEEGRPNKETVQKGAVSQGKAAELMNVSRRSVAAARKVVQKGVPELVQAVERGEIKVAAAQAIADAPKEQQVQAVKAGKQAVRELAKQQPKRKVRAKSPKEEQRERFHFLSYDLQRDPFGNSQGARLIEEFFKLKLTPVAFIALGKRGEQLTEKLGRFARECQAQILKKRRGLKQLRRHIAQRMRKRAAVNARIETRKKRAALKAARAKKPAKKRARRR